MMGDRVDIGFGNKFSQRDSQRNVQWNRQGIFRDDDMDVMFLHEFI